jgi:hypothetical protein
VGPVAATASFAFYVHCCAHTLRARSFRIGNNGILRVENVTVISGSGIDKSIDRKDVTG